MTFRFDRAIRVAMRKKLSADDASPAPLHAAGDAGDAGRYDIMRTTRDMVTRVARPGVRTLRRLLHADLKSELTQLQSDFISLRDDFISLRGDVTRLAAALKHTLAVIEASHGETSKAIGDLTAIVGCRFDELEIKVRVPISFDEKSYAIRLADGYLLAPRNEPMLVTMLADATSGGLEPGTRLCLKRLLDPGMAAADIGANIGLHTLPCARAVGPRGSVYAFEPHPEINALLTLTLRLNGLSWVHLHSEAVGARTAPGTFNVSSTSGHSSLYGMPSDGNSTSHPIPARIRPLDDLIPANTKIDVVKIDVEGAELDVLTGMTRVIADSLDIAIIAEYGPSHLARVGTDPQTWLAAFAAHGFTPLMIDEATGNCVAVTETDLKEVFSVNLAFIRPGGRAAARLLKT
jgi:FkbM family methyltransferase